MLNFSSIFMKTDTVSYSRRQAKTDKQNHETRSLLGFPLRTSLLYLMHTGPGLPDYIHLVSLLYFLPRNLASF